MTNLGHTPFISGSAEGKYPLDRGKHLIVAVDLLTYADETGAQDGAVYCLVSGFIASPRQWRQFDTAWRKVLEKYEVLEFHSINFFGRRKPFRKWSNDKARAFLAELVEGVLMPRRMTPVGGAINVSDFNSYTRGERCYLTMAKLNPNGRGLVWSGAPNRPYQLGLVSLFIDAIQASKSNSRIDFILDINDIEEGLAVQTFRYLQKENRSHPAWKRLGNIRYAPSEQEPGLQAADLYKYVWQRYIIREHEGKTLGREETYVMEQFKRKKSNLMVWEKAGFDLLLDNLPPQQRQRWREL